jgi:hypothetical protein
VLAELDGGGPELVASGHVLADASVAASVGELGAAQLGGDPTLFVLDFPGYDASLEHVVLGQPVASLADPQPSSFEVVAGVSPPVEGVVVRVRRADGSAVPGGFMVRIEQLRGAP